MKETGIEAVDQYAGGLVPVYSLRCKREGERERGGEAKDAKKKGEEEESSSFLKPSPPPYTTPCF